MRRVLFLSRICAVVVLVALSATPASAKSILDRYFSGSHLNSELSEDEITGTSKFEAELELRYRWEELSGFVRLSNDRPFPYQTGPFEIAKRAISYEFCDDWEVTAGDFSLIFGRGTALDAVEDRDVDRDAQLDGGKVEGDLGFCDVTAFWGQHKSDHFGTYVIGVNTDEGGPADELMGARLDFDFDDFDIGAGWVDADTTRYSRQMSTTVTEIDASYRFDDLTLYYETAWFNRDEPEGVEESMDGRAQLAEVLYGRRGLSLSGAWVRYDKAGFDYATAPSLRRTEVDHSEADANDEKGYRFECRLSPRSWEGHSVYLHYADLNGVEMKGRAFRNYFVEWSSDPTEEWSGGLSYDRVSGLLLSYGALQGTDESYRASLDGPFPLGGSFHLYGRYRLLKSAPVGETRMDDDEVELGLDWHVNPDFTVGLFRETSTRDIEPPPPGLYGIPTESPGEWNSAFVRWTPDPLTEIELIIGSQRGGFQCSGGVCAQLPPFKGIRFMYNRLL